MNILHVLHCSPSAEELTGTKTATAAAAGAAGGAAAGAAGEQKQPDQARIDLKQTLVASHQAVRLPQGSFSNFSNQEELQ